MAPTSFTDLSSEQVDISVIGATLTTTEREWRDRQPLLERAGYMLRPRYHPEWFPSWKGTNLDPTYCEDSVVINVRMLNYFLSA